MVESGVCCPLSYCDLAVIEPYALRVSGLAPAK